jgi:hypothetical protein
VRRRFQERRGCQRCARELAAAPVESAGGGRRPGERAKLGQMGRSLGLAGSSKKAEALLGRRGLGRGNEVGYFADWAENDFGLR